MNAEFILAKVIHYHLSQIDRAGVPYKLFSALYCMGGEL